MAQFQTFRAPLLLTLRKSGRKLFPSRLGNFSHQESLVCQLGDCVYPGHAKFIGGISIINQHRTNLDIFRQLDLHVATKYPEFLSALIDFVGEPNRDRVKIFVEARNRRFEQNPAGQWLQFVIDEARLRHAADNYRWLIAVAREYLNFLAVDQATCTR